MCEGRNNVAAWTGSAGLLHFVPQTWTDIHGAPTGKARPGTFGERDQRGVDEKTMTAKWAGVDLDRKM